MGIDPKGIREDNLIEKISIFWKLMSKLEKKNNFDVKIKYFGLLLLFCILNACNICIDKSIKKKKP